MWKQVHFQLFADLPDEMFERLSELENTLKAAPGVADAEAGKGAWEIDVRYDPDRIALDALISLVREAGLVVIPSEGQLGSELERPYKDFDEDAVYKEPRE